MPDSSFPTGNPAGFMLGKMDAGVGATEALKSFRADQGQMRNDRWFRLWGEISASRANIGTLAGLPGGAAIPYENMTEWSAGTAGRLAYQARVYVNRTNIGPTGIVTQFVDYKWSMVTSDVPLTPDQVRQAAEQQVLDGNAVGSDPAPVLGSVVTGAYVMQGLG